MNSEGNTVNDVKLITEGRPWSLEASKFKTQEVTVKVKSIEQTERTLMLVRMSTISVLKLLL